jgi:arylsulfatase
MILFYRNFKKPNFTCDSYNVILITADALRANHLTPYGYFRNTTPFLNELSKDSWLYLNAISQSGSTEESLSSLFTSRYPWTDGAINLKDKSETITEKLNKKGYYSKAIVSTYYTKSIFGFSKGFQDFDDNFDKWRDANETTELAISWLKINKAKPFFLWLHYREPHSPYNPPEDYKRMFYEPFIGEQKYQNYTIYDKKINLSSKDIYELTIAYDGNIRFLDDNLKILFQYLNESKLLDKSIIIFTADHGESLGEHLIFDHNDLLYGILHVPLIFKHPELSHRIIEQPVPLVDIYPTILDMLCIPLNQTIRGRSLLSDNFTNFQFSEFKNYWAISYGNQWKLVRGYCKNCIIYPENKTNQDFEKLFNLKTDPNEMFDLKQSSPNVYANLKNILDILVNSSLPARNENSYPEINVTEEMKEKLRELGY